MADISSSDDRPGAVSQPEDVHGDGPVTLEDRTEPGGQGSPDTNQGRAEPTVAATTEHPTPAKAGTSSIDDMNVGAADPQAPSHPAAAARSRPPASPAAPGTEPTGMSAPGQAADEVRPVADPTVSTGRASGPEMPVQDSAGTSHRAPGLQGTTGPGEAVESDVHAGAARMGPDALDTTGVGVGHGDAADVPTSGSEASPGTSEQHGVVHGIRLPDDAESRRS